MKRGSSCDAARDREEPGRCPSRSSRRPDQTSTLRPRDLDGQPLRVLREEARRGDRRRLVHEVARREDERRDVRRGVERRLPTRPASARSSPTSVSCRPRATPCDRACSDRTGSRRAETLRRRRRARRAARPRRRGTPRRAWRRWRSASRRARAPSLPPGVGASARRRCPTSSTTAAIAVVDDRVLGPAPEVGRLARRVERASPGDEPACGAPSRTSPPATGSTTRSARMQLGAAPLAHEGSVARLPSSERLPREIEHDRSRARVRERALDQAHARREREHRHDERRPDDRDHALDPLLASRTAWTCCVDVAPHAGQRPTGLAHELGAATRDRRRAGGAARGDSTASQPRDARTHRVGISIRARSARRAQRAGSAATPASPRRGEGRVAARVNCSATRPASRSRRVRTPRRGPDRRPPAASRRAGRLPEVVGVDSEHVADVLEREDPRPVRALDPGLGVLEQLPALAVPRRRPACGTRRRRPRGWRP